MLNKLIVYALSAMTLLACQSQSNYASNNTNPISTSSSTIRSTTLSTVQNSSVESQSIFNFIGRYETPNEEEGSYKQTLSIIPIGNNYEVSFWASLIKGEPNCQFTGQGWIEDETLWVDIGRDKDKQVLMYIKPLADKSGVDVFTREFDERFTMMGYCGGGGSLAGTYIKVE